MRKLPTVLLSAFLSGCAPVVQTFYLPVDRNYAVEGTTCGWVPHGGGRYRLTDQAFVQINMSPHADVLWMRVYLGLKPATVVRLQSAVVTLQAPESPAVELLLMKGPVSSLVPVDPAVPITPGGNPPDVWPLQARTTTPQASRFVVQLPQMQVDGQWIMIPPIEFEMVRRHGFMACVQ